MANVLSIIRFNFLSAEYDRELTLAAMRIVRGVMASPAMAALNATEMAPGLDMQDEKALLDWVKETAETAYHPIGTCKMGTDEMAVVDPELNVRGMKDLSVVDASIMPTLVSGNTNAPTIMVAEKFAAEQ